MENLVSSLPRSLFPISLAVLCHSLLELLKHFGPRLLVPVPRKFIREAGVRKSKFGAFLVWRQFDYDHRLSALGPACASNPG